MSQVSPLRRQRELFIVANGRGKLLSPKKGSVEFNELTESVFPGVRVRIIVNQPSR